jgi:hypothetical protein
MLGLAHADTQSIQQKLKKSHIEVRELVGKDLSPLILEGTEPPKEGVPIYFMTDDNVTQGQNQVNPVTGRPYKSVKQPNQVESVILYLPTGGRKKPELWKYSRYFQSTNPADDPSSPNSNTTEDSNTPPIQENTNADKGPQPRDQFEMYNLTLDPLEERNLANRTFATPETRKIQKVLNSILIEQRKEKRIYPRTLSLSYEIKATTLRE